MAVSWVLMMAGQMAVSWAVRRGSTKAGLTVGSMAGSMAGYWAGTRGPTKAVNSAD